MNTRVNSPIEINVEGGPNFSENITYYAEAYDVIEVSLAPAAADVEILLQPGLAAMVYLFGIKMNAYTQAVPGTYDVSFKVHSAANPAIQIESAILLPGIGAVSVLGAQPDKIFLSNAGATTKNVTIIIARDATP